MKDMNILDSRNLLPIGTVVRLKEGEKRLMITGVMQEDSGRAYDYISVLYPEGYMGAEYRYLFQDSDIEEVFFRGYEDEEREGFLEQLDRVVKEKQEKHQKGFGRLFGR